MTEFLNFNVLCFPPYKTWRFWLAKYTAPALNEPHEYSSPQEYSEHS